MASGQDGVQGHVRVGRGLAVLGREPVNLVRGVRGVRGVRPAETARVKLVVVLELVGFMVIFTCMILMGFDQ